MNKLHCLGLVIVAGMLAGCEQLPPEDVLIRNFRLHRQALDRLVGLAANDQEYPRISAGPIPPTGMSTARFSQYSELFREAHVENGLNRYPAYPTAVFVIVDSEIPLGGKSRSEGYVFSQVPLTPLVANLHLPELPVETHHGSGHRIAFRLLDGGWYVFADADW